MWVGHQNQLIHVEWFLGREIPTIRRWLNGLAT